MYARRRTLLRAAGFLLIFPTAYFLHVGYTESLFLALVLGCFLAVRRDHWWLAGALGGLAALTRINGLVLVPALAAEAWLEWDADGRHRLRAHWLAIGLVVVGFVGYLALNLAVYGDPLTFRAAGLPPGASINPATGVISGSPRLLGSYTVQVSADDGRSGGTTTDFRWTIAE